jgi:hypothetical protein
LAGNIANSRIQDYKIGGLGEPIAIMVLKWSWI